MKFRQLLALCYHYLVSDQDFKKSCDEVPIFKVECICVHKMVVLEIFAPNAMNATARVMIYHRLFTLLKLHVSKYFFFP